MNKEMKRGKEKYLIKWKGYDSTCNTWEPISNLYNCLDLVIEYE